MVHKVLVEKENELVCGTNKGFSLLELLLAMFILALIASVTIPGLQRLRPRYQQDSFVTHCNTLLAIAWQQALATGKVHRVFFDLKKRIMRAEGQTNEADAKKETFAPVQRTYDNAEFSWPKVLTIKEFYIGGTERLRKRGFKAEAIWFYVVPDGMVQEVIMNVEDASVADRQGRSTQLSIIINPFTARLRTYDTFQKP